MKTRILIGSCGGLTGCYLARQFKKIAGCTVIGADLSPKNAARPFLDDFIVLPAASSSMFRVELTEALNQQKINCYFPTHSQEIKAVSKDETWLRGHWDGNFLVSPYETFLKLDNKQTANENLQQAGLPVPRLIGDPSPDIKYPIFMKPNVGSGGKRTQAVESEILHREYAHIYPDCSFYEQIQGREFTVDCIFDDHGYLIGYNQRARLKSMGGAVIVTQNNYDFDIFPYLKKLESSFLIKGCVNFQYILSRGVPYFTDINLRYASGGLPLTVASGVDVPRILLDIFAGRPVDYVRSCSADRKTMYRYFEEWYEIL